MKVFRWLHLTEDALLVFSLLAMLVIALAQIVLRNGFDSGVLWAESFARVLVLWVAMLGAMVATRENNHISIDAASRYLPTRWQPYFAALTSLLAGLVCGIVAWYCLELVRFEYEDQTLAFAQVPNWACQIILPIGFAVMSGRFLILCVTRFSQALHR
jgi:TRAP-type C4-dicarboxylate transport system permease small subunit